MGKLLQVQLQDESTSSMSGLSAQDSNSKMKKKYILWDKLDHVYTPCPRGGRIIELIIPLHKMGGVN